MKEVLKICKNIMKYKKWLFLGIFCIVLEIITELFTPIITSNIINIGIQNNNIAYIFKNGFIMIGLTILSVSGGIFSTYFIEKAIGYAIYDIRNQLFKKITKLPFQKLEKLQTGKIVTLFTSDLSLVQSVFLLFFRIFIKVPFIFVGSICLCIMLSYQLSLLLLIMIPILILIVAIIMKKAYPYFELTQNGLDEVNQVIRENIDGVRVVRAFTNESYETKKFDRVNKNLKQINIKAIRTITLVAPLTMLIINLGIAYVLWFGGKEVIQGQLEIGNIIAFIQYLNSILASILTGSLIIIMMTKSKASITRIEDLLKEEEEIKKGSFPFKNLIDKIEYSNVFFKYQEGIGDYVLKNINISIKKGNKVGIIGPTGSGKSTLVNLLCGFYPNFEGTIQLDSRPYQDYHIASLRKKIEYIPNMPEFFSGTIEENLKFKNKKITKKQMLEALSLACFNLNHTKNNILKYKLEQKAKNLSGGEKQRLGIARALLTKADIFIFDDCFSAIDYKKTRQIQKNIQSLLKNKTVFYVTNRISNIKDVDTIIVLEDGMIKDIGTHEKLLKQNTFYQTMNSYERNE